MTQTVWTEVTNIDIRIVGTVFANETAVICNLLFGVSFHGRLVRL